MSLITVVVFLKGNLFLCEFQLKCLFVLIDPFSNLFCGDIIEWVRNFYALQNAHFFCYLHWVWLLVLWENCVLCGISNVDYFFDVKRSNEILGYDKWGTYHDIVNVFAGESHKNSFLDWEDREVLAFIELGHIIVPNAYIKEVTKRFSHL